MALKKLTLPENVCIAEYVWLDGFYKLRSKARTLDEVPNSPDDLPEWNYDGSSTGQAPGTDSEVILRPQAIYKDPFRGGPHILVMCDTYNPQGLPLMTNQRHDCAIVMQKGKDLLPWFGCEQEYFLIDNATGRPLGFPAEGYPAPQGPYYCGAGAGKIFGRDVAEEHYIACLYAGIKMSGINAEVAPGQWEFQIGPAVGMEEGDMMWMARYILERVTENYEMTVSYDAKPEKGDWNGSGAHTNFSTKPMRDEGGYEKAIIPALERLALKHKEHIAAYGEGNEHRLTGTHETSSMDKFSYAKADRGASVRIPNTTYASGKGYFEDRRPSASMDPYVVTKLLVSTCCDIPLPETKFSETRAEH
uniref:glutamine synthetase n=1 Tax=Rhodosorus marinus TaxID=101924 RepID=A0A7S2ZY97_9RHOD|mmetsp:Transcript_37284/g.148819  ORF Transcript_37284/g.148819 Transcript_37284/m.148819 type:complete len:361 (+) Transcript_37284:124-1206(+)|eukprot:CAMPEP_0113953810 /NCGR_PEP_ID=MMETSP0011_2-20120614/58_1 /TAXON_ID=101924 /ORGANISM="Rhodosorus marinus" /LENGTH=360 /DNA_ID=CAMNT_0000962577 /DNA_START=108 /DNA_END=1190 /DNA_ORIENTATION=- /assembly_acc=CAM_ASM_000156